MHDRCVCMRAGHPRMPVCAVFSTHHVLAVIIGWVGVPRSAQRCTPVAHQPGRDAALLCGAGDAQSSPMSMTALGTLGTPTASPSPRDWSPGLVASELALLRFIAGMRAMLALLTGLVALAYR